MVEDDLEFSVDPYDLLQEHDLMIQRLIKANNTMGAMLEELTRQHADLTNQILIISEYLKNAAE